MTVCFIQNVSDDFINETTQHYLCTITSTSRISLYSNQILEVELAWRSGSVMDCHTTVRGLIPGGNGEKTELQVLRKGQ